MSLEVSYVSPNSPSEWDSLWKNEGQDSWRKRALSAVYSRIERLLPSGRDVIDVGGGVGILASQIAHKCRSVTVWDHSQEALKQVREHGFSGALVNLEGPLPKLRTRSVGNEAVHIATEVLEHLSARARDRLLTVLSGSSPVAFFSVPNYRLGPEEEPQHTIKFSAISFKRMLENYFEYVRVEVIGPPGEPHLEPSFLLGVCGFPKKFSLSVTMPVRDEAGDIGKTLASFRGVADELVVGVDPRTKDDTWKICERYADKIFYVEDPEGPIPGKHYYGSRINTMLEQKRVPEGGAHFSWIRNQCLDQCSGDWIFMTEGHERLVEGVDALLNLHQLPEAARIGLVWRSQELPSAQRWGFPWLCVNNINVLYERSTHNSLNFPDSYLVVRLPQVRTLHDRVHARSADRAKQRKIQNRITLFDDWLSRGSEYSKYYLASEWREYDPERAEKHFRELLSMPRKHGDMRYQARLILAKLLVKKNPADARSVLLGCTEEDWQRTEHWIWLGDLAFEQNKLEEALQFYQYGALRINDPPFTVWWIEMSFYTYLPAQRLAMIYGELGNLPKALHWANMVLALLPEGSPQELIDETSSNISIIEEALNGPAA